MVFIEPLDLENILINSLAGSIEIFTFLAFIAIGIITTTLRIPKSITMALLALFAVMLGDYFPPIYLLIVVIAGLVAANATAKIITR